MTDNPEKPDLAAFAQLLAGFADRPDWLCYGELMAKSSLIHKKILPHRIVMTPFKMVALYLFP